MENSAREIEKKMCSQIWLSDNPAEEFMTIFQKNSHVRIESSSSVTPREDFENDSDLVGSESGQGEELDEDELVFEDCEPISSAMFVENTQQLISDSRQFSKFEELCPEIRKEQNNMERKRSWKRKKCLSLDSKRWDNAKNTISKGRPNYVCKIGTLGHNQQILK